MSFFDDENVNLYVSFFTKDILIYGIINMTLL